MKAFIYSIVICNGNVKFPWTYWVTGARSQNCLHDVQLKFVGLTSFVWGPLEGDRLLSPSVNGQNSSFQCSLYCFQYLKRFIKHWTLKKKLTLFF